MKKDNWIEKVEQSSRGISEMEPSADLWSKIQKSVNKTREIKFTPKQIFAMAASIFVLVCLNLSLVVTSNAESSSEDTSLLKEQISSGSSDNIYGEL